MSTTQTALRIPDEILAEAKLQAQLEDRKAASMLIILIKRGLAHPDSKAQRKKG